MNKFYQANCLISRNSQIIDKLEEEQSNPGYFHVN